MEFNTQSAGKTLSWLGAGLVMLAMLFIIALLGRFFLPIELIPLNHQTMPLLILSLGVGLGMVAISLGDYLGRQNPSSETLLPEFYEDLES